MNITFNRQSILKTEKYRVNFNKNINLLNIMNFDNIITHDYLIKPLSVNGFIISKKERYFFVEKSRFFNDEDFYQMLECISEYPDIYSKYNNNLHIIKKNEHFITSDLSAVIKYIYTNLLIYLEIAAYKYKNNIDNSKEQVNINRIVRKQLDYSERQDSINISKYKRSKIHEKSKNCLFWNKYEFSNKLPISIIKIVEKLNIKELELPLKYDKNKTVNLLKQLLFVFDYIKLENRDLELRFKKLGHYKKEGLYIKNAKCLIVDPVHSLTIFHELGHFIYENNVDFYLEEQKISSKFFKNIIKNEIKNYTLKFKNHKIEDLDVDSETFAYWFEDQIKKVLSK